jgi:type VI protein secretion system component Hcp
MPTVENASRRPRPASRHFLKLACLVGGLAAGAVVPALAQQSDDASKTAPVFQLRPLELPRLPAIPPGAVESQSGSPAQPASAAGSFALFTNAKGYLRLDGVPGPAAHERYRGWIELLGITETFSSGAGLAARGGAATGKAEMHPVTVTKPMDSGSVPLRRLAVSGQPVPRAELVLMGGPGSLELYRLTLDNVNVVRVSTVMENAGVVEEVDLVYDRVTWQFAVYRPDGSSGGSLRGCWDYRANREC